jgi:uncharacterized membrane protein (DUF373 family)
MREKHKTVLINKKQNRFDLSNKIFFCVLIFDLLLQKGAKQMRRLFKNFRQLTTDESFMHLIEKIEVIVAKILSLCMLIVILAAICDLVVFMGKELLSFANYGSFYKTLFKIFGLFLNVLIALEILENITGYLKKHVLQVELVIVTSLIAVARKIIILDLDKVSGMDIIGLGIAVLSLSISYFIIRIGNSKPRH